jgi:AcrR family transcriptional regulator
MGTAPRTRDQQRAWSEAAILDAAERLFADAGPDGTSIRDVARSAGLTHGLVLKYFGSKAGLVAAVGSRVTELVASHADLLNSGHRDGFAEWLKVARDHRSTTKLLIRCALGDIRPDGFPGCLDGPLPWSPTGGDTPVERRARICRYSASSLLFGWLTFDGFLTCAVRLGNMGDRRRDRVMAETAAYLSTLAATSEPALEPRRIMSHAAGPESSAEPDHGARDALLDAAVEMFAHDGPASVSIRDVARRAGVSHGLVHRHVGSKNVLLAEAIDVGVSSLLPGVDASTGFDIDRVVREIHRNSAAPKLIARTLIDDIPIGTVRHRYPVMHGLLALVRETPADARPAHLADPRLATAAVGALVGGSAIWGPSLCEATGIGHDELEAAIADLTRHLLGLHELHELTRPRS